MKGVSTMTKYNLDEWFLWLLNLESFSGITTLPPVVTEKRDTVSVEGWFIFNDGQFVGEYCKFESKWSKDGKNIYIFWE